MRSSNVDKKVAQSPNVVARIEKLGACATISIFIIPLSLLVPVTLTIRENITASDFILLAGLPDKILYVVDVVNERDLKNGRC